jgi:hypothetical protein
MMDRRLPMVHLLTVALAAAVFAALALGVAGCGGESALDGTDWKLVRWSESSLDPAGITITADFEDARIGGSADGSSYGGPYETGPGDDFSMGPLSSAGGGFGSRAEATYFHLLKVVETYSREGDTLTLYDAEGNESLVFELVPASD